MVSRFRAPLGAMLILLLGAATASAGSAVSSADMIAHEGPGDEFKTLWTVPAGSQVDIRECNPFQWCFVKQRDKQGWVHVERVDAAPSRRSGGSGGTADGTSSTAIAELPGDQGSKGGGSSRPTRGGGGSEGFKAADSGSGSDSGSDAGSGGGSFTQTSPQVTQSDSNHITCHACGGGGTVMTTK